MLKELQEYGMVIQGAAAKLTKVEWIKVDTPTGISNATVTLATQEADIVAQAGQSVDGKGVVTIATNMAGRGTDIKLSKEVKDAGGLAIIGTERHESRRVDRQLRGRAGRQGDPGSSMFFVFCRLRQLDYIIMFVFICQDVSFDFPIYFHILSIKMKY